VKFQVLECLMDGSVCGRLIALNISKEKIGHSMATM
jgi:hypothetical protein